MESIDIGDALLKGSINQFNLFEFTLRINIVGVKKTIVTIYKDRKFRVNKQIEFENYELYKNELECLNQYIKSLKQIAKEYEDKYTLDYVIDLENTNIYARMEALEKSAKNAEKAGVPNEKILHDINDLDRRFKKERL